jgi:hypothetical protein
MTEISEDAGPTLGEAYWRGYVAKAGIMNFPIGDLTDDIRRAIEAGAAAAGATAIARLNQGKPKPAREPHAAFRMILGPCPVHAGTAHAQIGDDDEWFCLRDLADTAEAAADPDHEPGLSECGCRACDPGRHGTAPDLADVTRALDLARDELTSVRNVLARVLGEFKRSGHSGHFARLGQMAVARAYRDGGLPLPDDLAGLGD